MQINFKNIENLWHLLTSDVLTLIMPGLQYLHDNVPAAAITIGEGVLASAATGTPWAALEAALLAEAEKQGIAIAEGTATAILNAAQTNRIAKGAAPASA